MSNKQILGALAVLVILAVLVGMWAKPNAPAEAPTAGDKSTILGGTLESDQNYRYKEVGAGYVIEVEYPAAVPLPTPEASKKAALTIETGLAGAIGVFKADLAQMLTTEEVARLQAMGAHYALGFEYTDYAAEGNHSYAYQVYQDTGGAHPNAFYLTYVFDTSGNMVRLEDLFESGAPYLQRLSAAAYPKVVADLRARTNAELSPDMLETVRMGTAPSPEALQFFYLTDDAIHLLFPPYQVASYAAGSFDIAIPRAELSDILKTP